MHIFTKFMLIAFNTHLSIYTYTFYICFIKIISFFNIISYTCEISHSLDLSFIRPRKQTNKKIYYFTFPFSTLTLKSTRQVRRFLKKCIPFSENFSIEVKSTPEHVNDRHSVINYQTKKFVCRNSGIKVFLYMIKNDWFSDKTENLFHFNTFITNKIE